MSQASSDKATPGRLTVTLTSSHSHLALNKWCMATIIWMISRSLSIGQIYKAVCHILRDVLAYTAHCTRTTINVPQTGTHHANKYSYSRMVKVMDPPRPFSLLWQGRDRNLCAPGGS